MVASSKSPENPGFPVTRIDPEAEECYTELMALNAGRIIRVRLIQFTQGMEFIEDFAFEEKKYIKPSTYDSLVAKYGLKPVACWWVDKSLANYDMYPDRTYDVHVILCYMDDLNFQLEVSLYCTSRRVDEKMYPGSVARFMRHMNTTSILGFIRAVQRDAVATFYASYLPRSESVTQDEIHDAYLAYNQMLTDKVHTTESIAEIVQMLQHAAVDRDVMLYALLTLKHRRTYKELDDLLEDEDQ